MGVGGGDREVSEWARIMALLVQKLFLRIIVIWF